MRIVVVYGFLGSGKTTLINYLLGHSFANQKVVVLENESGKESVDGDLLRAEGYQVVDLVSGCVCCTLRSDLVCAVKQIKQTVAPDLLFIEPSGLAALEDLLKINDLRFDAIITLVDASRYDLFMHINRSYFERQYRLSPTFLITKTDLVEAQKCKELENILTTINPQSLLFDNLKSLNVAFKENLIYEQCHKFTAYLLDSTIHKSQFAIENIAIEKPQSMANIEALFAALKSETAKLIRAKGLLKINKRDTNSSSIYKLDFTNSALNFIPIYNAAVDVKFGITFWWYEEQPTTTIAIINKYLNL